MGFDWDEHKREANLQRHGIDFLDAKDIWLGIVLEVQSTQTHHGETRFMAMGPPGRP